MLFRLATQIRLESYDLDSASSYILRVQWALSRRYQDLVGTACAGILRMALNPYAVDEFKQRKVDVDEEIKSVSCELVNHLPYLSPERA